MNRNWLILFTVLCACPSEEKKPEKIDLVQAVMDQDQMLIRLALERGADLEQTNLYGDTALIWAVNREMPVLVKTLLESGADPNHGGSEGKTPLIWAAQSGLYESAEILLSHGADHNLRDIKGRSALHWATFKCRLDLMRLLLEAGADIDASDRWGQTPAMFALHGQCQPGLERLVVAGCSLDHISAEHETIFDVANKLNKRGYFFEQAILEKVPDVDQLLNENLLTVITNADLQPEIDLNILEREVHEEVNRVRQEHGLRSVRWETLLHRTAQLHSADMSYRSYFNHYNPEGEGPSDRARKMGYSQGAGENLYMCRLYKGAMVEYKDGKRHVTREWEDPGILAAKAVDAWLNSPGHRKNLLDPNYSEEGIGVKMSHQLEIYFTQNLGF